MSTGHRIAPALLLGAGIVLAAGSLLPDVLGIGAPGLGTRQTLGVAAGLALILVAAPTRRWMAKTWFQAPAIGPRECVLLGIWFGVLTGLFEIVHLGVRHYAAGLVLKQAELTIALVPLTHTLLFGACGLVLAVLAIILPRLVTGAVAVSALVLLAVFSELALHPQIGNVAVTVVCVGAAVQAARGASVHWQRFVAFRRKTMPWLLGALVLAVVGVPSYRAFAEYRAMADLPVARAGAPNVLLIVIDTMRADHLQCYGYERDTSPNIAALAEDGVVFERFVSTSPWTLPSHATMFTGRYSHENDANWLAAMSSSDPTLAEVLSRQGYATAGFAGNLGYCTRAYGVARGFAHYKGYGFEFAAFASAIPIGRLLFPRAKNTDLVRHDAATITSSFIEWLPSRGDRPFFAFLNLFDAHSLYRVPAPLRQKYGNKYGKTRLDPGRWRTVDPSREFVQELVNAYDGCLGYIDEHVGHVVEHLRQEGLLDNTLIIVTGDHGEHFGEQGLVSHGNSLYWPQLNVPLVIRFPDSVPAGQRVDEFVSMRDLPATIMDVIGVEPDVEFPGVSLRPLWNPGSAAAPFAGSKILSEVRRGIGTPTWEPIYKGDMKSEVVDGMLHIWNGDGTEEQYDLRLDPSNEHNLIGK